MNTYEIIKNFYGEQRAKRSGVLLMNHIEEGLAILDALKASDDVKSAFCIHPIVQNLEDGWEELPVSTNVMYLANQYRLYANAYLCKPENDYIECFSQLPEHFVSKGLYEPMDSDVALMLYADKVQNRKDFRLYHKGVHERSGQLEAYFDIWIDYLLTCYGIV